jgi:hypothetical protein
MTIVEDSSAKPVVMEERERSRKRSAWSTATALTVVAALIGVGIWLLVRDGGSTTDGTPTTGAAPFHAIAADSEVVSGTAACDFSNQGIDPEGGAGLLVVCELDMSDPRVSGTERHDRFRIFNGGDLGDVWVAEEATITNADGTWRGMAQAADDGTPSGEANYIGEGAYDGLEFHYYFGHLEDIVLVRGWISGSG